MVERLEVLLVPVVHHTKDQESPQRLSKIKTPFSVYLRVIEEFLVMETV